MTKVKYVGVITFIVIKCKYFLYYVIVSELLLIRFCCCSILVSPERVRFAQGHIKTNKRSDVLCTYEACWYACKCIVLIKMNTAHICYILFQYLFALIENPFTHIHIYIHTHIVCEYDVIVPAFSYVRIR